MITMYVVIVVLFTLLGDFSDLQSHFIGHESEDAKHDKSSEE
jgi:hypothetical protein